MALLPFDDRDGVIWFDGKLVPWRDAKLHVLSHGLHYASCVFEGERAYAGKVFKLSEHSQRLLDSAAVLDMSPIPWSRQDIDDATNAVLKANNFKDAYVRPVMWRGSEMMAVSAQNAKPHLAIACWEWPSYFGAEARANGIRLAMAQYRRPAPDTAPTQAKAAGLYMICTLSKHKAQREGFDDASNAGLSRLAGRGHGREFVPGAKGGIAHADARLLPEWHYPPGRDFPCPRQPNQSRRTRHPPR